MLIGANPTVSRVDLCFDFYSENFSFENVTDRQWVTPAKLITTRLSGNERSGFEFGKSGIKCRIYDKTREIVEQSKKFYLYELWKEEGWDGESKVWRVEFQFTTEFLVQIGIRSINQILSNQENLWAYATQEWLKLVIPKPNDSNRSRWRVHRAWREIQNATSEGGQPVQKEVTKKRLPSNETLFVNGLGYLISFMTVNRVTDLEEALKAYGEQVRTYHELQGSNFDSMISSKVRERAKRFNIPLEELKP
jgi:hypothetical protein